MITPDTTPVMNQGDIVVWTLPAMDGMFHARELGPAQRIDIGDTVLRAVRQLPPTGRMLHANIIDRPPTDFIS